MIANHVEIPEDGKDARQDASVLPRWLCLRVCEALERALVKDSAAPLLAPNVLCTAHADNAMRFIATLLVFIQHTKTCHNAFIEAYICSRGSQSQSSTRAEDDDSSGQCPPTRCSRQSPSSLVGRIDAACMCRATLATRPRANDDQEA